MGIEIEQPWWMHNVLLCGNEGEGDSGGEGTGGDAGSGAGSEGGDGGDDDSGDSTDNGDDDGDLPPDSDIEGLKSALKKERTGNKSNARTVRALEKKLRDAQKQLDEVADKDKSEAEKAIKKAEQEAGKVAKLATRLRTQAVDTLIERFAREANFIDVDDALTGIDRSGIEVEQDEDDPADITVSAKSVKAAVKALADKKKHLIGDGSGGGDGTPSGSRFNGGPKDKAKASEAILKERYPSLR